jgi:hypothetical protein
MAQWYFKPKTPGDTIREPIHGEFFAADAISDPGRALVREAIQNSLDACADEGKVLVRIYLSGPNSPVASSNLSPYFVGAWEHLRAVGNGLQPEGIPSAGDPCPFLVFEDFGTKGLQGDTAEAFKPKTGRKNNFYHFFRAEGQSDKDQLDRGSWGVGKHVFVRASRISTMFGLTVRADDHQHLLMGRAILKSHWLDNSYCQDGYFGTIPSETQQLVMPITDVASNDRFCQLFDLQRGEDPGLSIVVPWPDPEITDKAIISGVLYDYFYPILVGQLEVIVETPSIKTVLHTTSLVKEVQRLRGIVSDDLEPLIELAAWARDVPPVQRRRLEMPAPDRAWTWSDQLIPESLRQTLRQSYLAGEGLAVRVPVTVRSKHAPPQASYFDVFLVRDGTESTGRPTFIREGIIITRVDAPRTRGARAIVLTEDLPLAAFLRAAENPSHTEWQSIRLKDAYKVGCKADLLFVKRSVQELVHMLTTAEQDQDPSLLVDLFSLPATEEDEDTVKTRTKKSGKKRGAGPPSPSPQPTSRLRRFRIQKVKGGFSVLPGDDGATPPARLEIRAAYFVRHGNPLRKYNQADFRINQPPIRFDPPPQGVEILEHSDNRVLVAIKELGFGLHLTGFDEKRDLYVRAVPKEESDGDTTP